MAIIPYHSIRSLIFAKLTRSSRILIPVLSCLCDDWDGSLSPEHSKHHVLAMYAGLGVASIKRALKELSEKGIITTQTQQGKPASIYYTPQVELSAKTSKHSSQRATFSLNIAQSELPFPAKIPPQTPTPVSEKQPGTILPLNDSPKSLKNKQTALVPRSLIRTWWPIKGPKFVMSVLREMEKKNGEVKDPAAYFATCCKNGWVPTSKQRERELAAEAAREERTLYEQAGAERWEREKQSIMAEHDDPELQARIRTIQNDFLEKMGESERVHNPPP